MKAVKLRPMEEVLAETTALCPVCLNPLPAHRIRRGTQVFLERTCPEHGPCSVLIWEGAPSYEAWGGPSARQGVPMEDAGSCPRSCGLCGDHRRPTCCLLFEVTQRCDLGCPVCYAASGAEAPADPSLEELGRWYDAVLAKSGRCNIQLSGGEPTVRDDLPAVIALGKQKGFPYLQLNTNGLRLASEPGYAAALKEAGLDCVFLQFDAMEDAAYTAIRGRPLLKEKLAAADACVSAGLGLVLVPTLVPGVNDGQAGEILRYAVANMPGVRGVHFQPVSHLGRRPGGKPVRLTLPGVLRLIEDQTGGAMRAAHFKPGTAENPYCSFNGAYLLEPDGSLTPLNPRQGCCCGGGGTERAAVSRAQQYVARQWGRDGRRDHPGLLLRKPGSLDEFLARTRQYTLAVSGMAFMDPWTADLARLRECYIHVMKDGARILPFCACNLFHRGGSL